MVTILPMLSYADAAAAIRFLTEAFGFDVTMRMDGEDGTVGHAELALGEVVVSLASVWHDGGLATPHELGGVHTQLMVGVDDVDGHWRQARDAGAVVVGEPVDQDYGQRTYRAVDPEGHHWIFAGPPAS